MKKTILGLSFLIGILTCNLDVEAKELNYFSDGNGSGNGSHTCYNLNSVNSDGVILAFDCSDCTQKRTDNSRTAKSNCNK